MSYESSVINDEIQENRLVNQFETLVLAMLMQNDQNLKFNLKAQVTFHLLELNEYSKNDNYHDP